MDRDKACDRRMRRSPVRFCPRPLDRRPDRSRPCALPPCRACRLPLRPEIQRLCLRAAQYSAASHGSGATPLDDNLTWVSSAYQTVRASQDLLERLVAWQAGENDVGLRANLLWGTGRRSAAIFEFRDGSAAIPEDAISRFDEMSTDRQPDLANTDEAYRVHLRHPAPPPC